MLNYLYKTLIALLLIHGNSYAQQISIHTVNSGGQAAAAGGIQLEVSVGGFAVKAIDAGALMLTQDFLQPFSGIAGSIPDIDAPVLSSAGPDNAGTTFVSSGTMLEFTVGEFASLTLSGDGQLLTQGILQPYLQEPALPVTLVDFQARYTEKHSVLLSWSTTAETRNKGFEVERRLANEDTFQNIAFVKSAAANGHSSSNLLTYSLTDLNPYTGLSYYRLKQVDTDGSFSYSGIRVVKSPADGTLALKAWPVPSPDGRLWVEMPGAGRDVLLVFSADGRLLRQSGITGSTPQSLHLPLSGVYLLRLAGQKAATRVIVR